jgi:superfamily II DNA or RNA helicase
MALRPYQQATLSAIKENFNKGAHRQLVSSATGTGKSVTLSHIPETMRSELPGQMLVLVHREELVDQNISKLKLYNPELSVSKEMAGDYADVNADVIVASVATLGRSNSSRADRFPWEKITTVVTDECHHSTAQSYLNIYERADVLRTDTHKLHVGFTATPSRADGEGLYKVYDKIVFQYGMRQAIEDGYLVEVKGIRVPTSTSLDGVKTVKGDFDQKDLADAVNNPERNQRIVKAWLDVAEGRRTVAFTVDIAHAKDMAEMFRHYGVKAEAIWGDDPDRADKLKRHQAGEITVLANCGVLTEGYDDPGVSCIVLARPTKSGVFFTQAVGRGTRLLEGKADCLVLDVVDASSRHSLVTLPTLMGMSAKLDLKGQGVVFAAKQLEEAQKQFPHINFNDLPDIGQLKSYVESVSLFDIKFPAEVEQNSQLSWYPNATGGYTIMLPDKDSLMIEQNLLDKWELSGRIRGKKYRGERDTVEAAFKAADDLIHNVAPEVLKVLRREETWHGDPATPSQLKLLTKFYKGKPIPPDLTKGKASRLIGSFMAGKA